MDVIIDSVEVEIEADCDDGGFIVIIPFIIPTYIK